MALVSACQPDGKHSCQQSCCYQHGEHRELLLIGKLFSFHKAKGAGFGGGLSASQGVGLLCNGERRQAEPREAQVGCKGTSHGSSSAAVRCATPGHCKQPWSHLSQHCCARALKGVGNTALKCPF